MRNLTTITAAALAFAVVAPVATAQTAGEDTTMAAPATEEDNDFPWGLLGLLGLAGLLGRKRDDRVDTRRS